MNKKLSGAQMVLVPIERVGINKIPYQDNLRGRVIKYIDFHIAPYCPGTDKPGVTIAEDMYITILDEYANTKLQSNLPLTRIDYQNTLGIRQPIFEKISVENSYILCENSDNVGKVAMLVFWYDLPEFSARNNSDRTIIDSVSIPLTTSVLYNQFPDEERLAGKRFRRLLVFDTTTTPDLQDGIDYQYLQNLYLTLRKGSYAVVSDLPLMLLYQLQMLEKTEFANIIFDFQSSYITIGGAGSIENVNEDYIGKSVFINLQYEAK